MREDIRKILEKRASYIPYIDYVINNYRDVSACLSDFESFKAELLNDEGDIVDSPYAVLLKQRPELHQLLQSLSTQALTLAIGSQLKKIERIRKRFCRHEISIQIYGKAGNGKSQLVRSITGLPEDVVPTTNINEHCTGASSYIANSSTFVAHIYFYSPQDILDKFNKGLSNALWANHLDTGISLLNDFNEIEFFNPSNYGLDENSKGVDSLLLYKNHFQQMRSLVNQTGLLTDMDGNKYKEIVTKEEIRTYVAQHNGLPTDDANFTRYFNYLAVRYAKIYTTFEYEDAGDILLMDNVGLGDVVNDASTKQNMYQAVADNSDAVIILYSPTPMGQSKADEAELLELLDDLRHETIDGKEEERVNVHGLFLLLNERKTEKYNNVLDCKAVREKFTLPKEKNGFGRQETILIADASNPLETTNKALVPILTQLLNNLLIIDENKVKEVNKESELVYKELSKFCNKIKDIIFDLPNDGDIFHIIWKKTKELIDSIATNLGVLYSEADNKKNKSYGGIESAVQKEKDSIFKNIKKKNQILERINVKLPTESIAAIYDSEMSKIRSTISNKFEKSGIDSIKDLPNMEVKDPIYKLLYDVANWKKLPLKAGTFPHYSAEWINAVKEEYLKNFPSLVEAIDFIQKYEIRVDDYLDYQIESALSILDFNTNDYEILRPKFPEKKEDESLVEHNSKMAKAIWQGMYNHLTELQQRLNGKFDTLSILPYHSIYARIRKFREKLLMSENGIEELEAFYFKNCRIFWPELFVEQNAPTEGQPEWNTLVGRLLTMLKRELYIVTLKPQEI